MKQYAQVPAGARRGVVVIHEVLGLQPEIRRVVDRFAARGYAAVAPDLFENGAFACLRRAMQTLRTAHTPEAARIRAARDWLCNEAKLSKEAVGVIGFCLGGGFALALGPEFGAVSTNYGEVPPAERMRGIGPVIGCYGGRDPLFGRHGDKLRAGLAPLGVEPEVHTYVNVGHSFLTDGDHPVLLRLAHPFMATRALDAGTREEAWAQIFGFFDRTLQAVAGGGTNRGV